MSVETIMHEDYDDKTKANDIALLNLPHPYPVYST